MNQPLAALRLIGCFGLSLVAMSFVEHYVHRHVMHRKHGLSLALKPINKVFADHAFRHHQSYLQNFTDPVVAPGEDQHIRLSIKRGLLQSIPVGLLLAYFCWWPAGLLLCAVVALHHLVWNHIHLEMHKPQGRFFTAWPIYRALRRHHLVHHRFPSTNFNLVLPLADFVLGTRASAEQTWAAARSLCAELRPAPKIHAVQPTDVS